MIALSKPVRLALEGFRRCALFAATLTAATALSTAAQASPYSQVIVFGDSLSDTGNFAHITMADYGISYPGGQFNYSDHRFTDSSDTSPASQTFAGVWHEQLTRRFLGMTPATNSLDGGLDYAVGDAQSTDGQTTVTIEGNATINVDNLGRQVSTYLTSHTADANALYIVWCGANDLFQDSSAGNVTATSTRIGDQVTKLAQAGARTFIVPNLPPLGDTPSYNTTSSSDQLNAASASYRDQLNSVLDTRISALQQQGINITVYRLDVYTLFQNLIGNPSVDGFTNITNSAQGQSVTADQYLFWDGVHPTTAGHNQVALAAADLVAGAHPDFFKNEAFLAGDFAYLKFASGQEFGYYSYQYYPYLYQTNLGFEYVIPSTTGDSGVYLYDFKLGTFLFTTPSLWPYLYNFNEGAFDYYFTNTTNPRVFYSFKTNSFVYSN